MSKISLGNKTFGEEILQIEPIKHLIMLLVGLLMIALHLVGALTPLNDLLTGITRTPRTEIYSASVKLEQLWSNLGKIGELSEENARLQQQISGLESKLADVEVVFQQNEALFKETGIKFDRDYETVGALVISFGQIESGKILVNKGSNEGLNAGDIVAIENILIGRVVEVESFSATAELITSTNSIIPVKTQQGGNLGLLGSTDGSNIIVEQILQTRQVVEGDLVFTSGVNELFPPDLYIGKIAQVTTDERAPVKSAKIDYPLNLKQLTKVKVILMPK